MLRFRIGGNLKLNKLKFYEFFAGIGMARSGLGDGWDCIYANDCDRLKKSSYTVNWDDEHFDARDVAEVTAADLEGMADLAWASFPCQDLSQAGSKAGIGVSEGSVVTRSGAVWPFLNIIGQLRAEGRHPAILTLENVVGLLSSNGGADFRALCASLGENGYRFGAIVADAAHFVPQSRPRVFIIAVRREVAIPESLLKEMGKGPWHPQVLLRSRALLPPTDSENWLWWWPGDPPNSKQFELEDVIDLSDGAKWNSDEATDRLLGMMSDAHRNRLAAAKVAGYTMIGSLYLRMRPNGKAGNIQRAEIAFGSTLGCLRTPKGGASRPRIVVVEGDRVRTRLLSVDEAARLMGLENFILPATYNECFRLIGDGVVPAVVRCLADRLLEPLAEQARLFISAPGGRKVPA
jgi:DNA (cytosine-5)-methyltransferase 1